MVDYKKNEKNTLKNRLNYKFNINYNGRKKEKT